MISDALLIETLGQMPYLEAWQLQKRYHTEIATGDRSPTLLLLEHPKTITFGRSTKPTSLLHSEAAYRAMGYEVHHVERGGDVTYHGPGQLVGYPIFPLNIKVGDFLRQLEQVLLRTVTHFGITARPSPGYAGLWTNHPAGHEAKLASIGIAVSKRVTYHGFALNVCTHRADFNDIVPCGLTDVRMTSLAELVVPPLTLDQVQQQIIEQFQMNMHRFSSETHTS